MVWHVIGSMFWDDVFVGNSILIVIPLQDVSATVALFQYVKSELQIELLGGWVGIHFHDIKFVHKRFLYALFDFILAQNLSIFLLNACSMNKWHVNSNIRWNFTHVNLKKLYNNFVIKTISPNKIPGKMLFVYYFTYFFLLKWTHCCCQKWCFASNSSRMYGEWQF